MEQLTIYDILRLSYMKESFSYIGKLRNEQVFNIGQSVFFSPSEYQGCLFRGIIVGIELTNQENPEYLYKIQIPEEMAVLADEENENKIFEKINCSSIFNSVAEAKASALQNCEHLYKVQTEAINLFFSRYTKTK